jgi:uncharacterized protein (DUF169 family)
MLAGLSSGLPSLLAGGYGAEQVDLLGGAPAGAAWVVVRQSRLEVHGDMPDDGFNHAAMELTNILGLAAPPIAITFSDEPPAGVEPFGNAMPEPTAGGRTGRVPAGCVFWIHAANRTFSTVPEDHGNCSVGMLTHGMLSLEDAAVREDVKAIFETGWVTPEAAAGIPTISQRHSHITYGPLSATSTEPDVVLLRLNARGLMVLMDSWPGLRVEGKPQCHIVAVAKEHSQMAVSSGCALSRARTGMPASEMTCAIPGPQLPAVLDALRKTAEIDTTVARYAAGDGRRFSQRAAMS